MRDAFIADLKQQYGDRLVSVIEHQDEAHPHVHFYVVPKSGDDFDAVHPGYKARRESRAAAKAGKLELTPTPKGKKKRKAGYAIGAAFRTAMQHWQIGIFERVCKQFGFERLGPVRKRLDRDEYFRRQRETKITEKEAQTEELLRAAKEDAKKNAIALQNREAINQKLQMERAKANKTLETLKATPEHVALQRAATAEKALAAMRETLEAETKARLKVEKELGALERRIHKASRSKKMTPTFKPG